MNNKTRILQYKGQEAVILYSIPRQCFVGHIASSPEIVIVGKTAADFVKEFHEKVDGLLKRQGKERRVVNG